LSILSAAAYFQQDGFVLQQCLIFSFKMLSYNSPTHSFPKFHNVYSRKSCCV